MTSDTSPSSIPPSAPRQEGECMACYADRYWQHPENSAFSAHMHQVIAEIVESVNLEEWGLSADPIQCDPNDPEVQRLKRYMEEMRQRHSQIPRSTSCSCVGASS